MVYRSVGICYYFSYLLRDPALGLESSRPLVVAGSRRWARPPPRTGAGELTSGKNH